mmetsp:Transcript_32632/g.82522  ORF Transcript_32632/g.82522 Transcript_32632/m.82522 type:complete len:498 (-) Transcript_32632:4232-5725(-)
MMLRQLLHRRMRALAVPLSVPPLPLRKLWARTLLWCEAVAPTVVLLTATTTTTTTAAILSAIATVVLLAIAAVGLLAIAAAVLLAIAAAALLAIAAAMLLAIAAALVPYDGRWQQKRRLLPALLTTSLTDATVVVVVAAAAAVMVPPSVPPPLLSPGHGCGPLTVHLRWRASRRQDAIRHRAAIIRHWWPRLCLGSVAGAGVVAVTSVVMPSPSPVVVPVLALWHLRITAITSSWRQASSGGTWWQGRPERGRTEVCRGNSRLDIISIKFEVESVVAVPSDDLCGLPLAAIAPEALHLVPDIWQWRWTTAAARWWRLGEPLLLRVKRWPRAPMPIARRQLERRRPGAPMWRLRWPSRTDVKGRPVEGRWPPSRTLERRPEVRRWRGGPSVEGRRAAVVEGGAAVVKGWPVEWGWWIVERWWPSWIVPWRWRRPSERWPWRARRRRARTIIEGGSWRRWAAQVTWWCSKWWWQLLWWRERWRHQRGVAAKRCGNPSMA